MAKQGRDDKYTAPLHAPFPCICILMLSSLPCFPIWCCSAIPKFHYLFMLLILAAGTSLSCSWKCNFSSSSISRDCLTLSLYQSIPKCPSYAPSIPVSELCQCYTGSPGIIQRLPISPPTLCQIFPEWQSHISSPRIILTHDSWGLGSPWMIPGLPLLAWCM